MAEKIFRFRVLLDQEEEVFRDIQIEADETFDSFNQVILKSFGFSGMEMASFYMSNEEWDKGEEITQMDMGAPDGRPIKTMTDTNLSDMLTAEGQKMLYLYDFMRMWIFFIELSKIEEPEEQKEYPAVALAVGEAPDETDKSPVDVFPSDSDEDFSGFENIDDLEE